MEGMFYKGLITIRDLKLVIDGFLWGLCISVWHTVSNIKSPCTVTYRGTTDVLWSFRCNIQRSHLVLVTLVSRWLWGMVRYCSWDTLMKSKMSTKQRFKISSYLRVFCHDVMLRWQSFGIDCGQKIYSGTTQSFDSRDPLVASSVRRSGIYEA